MIGENGTPETPEWSLPESKCCPFPNCSTCETEQQAIWLHGVDEHIVRGDN